MTGADPLLAVEDLSVTHGDRRTLDGATLAVERGECVGLVGESGAGKSTLVRTVVALLDEGVVRAGDVRLDGESVVDADASRLDDLRGSRVGVAFQDGAFDPAYRVGRQVLAAVRAGGDAPDDEAARERALELLANVGVPDPAATAERYPHQLSDGTARRARIAAALAGDPDLLLVDEPTAGLDATVAADVLERLGGLAERGTGVLLVTHDLGVVAGACDRAAVLYAGRVVERAPVDALFSSPAHPHTAGLLAARPRLGDERDRLPVLPGRHPTDAVPSGCAFHPRCPYAEPVCADERPSSVAVDGDHEAACLAHSGRLDGELDYRIEREDRS